MTVNFNYVYPVLTLMGVTLIVCFKMFFSRVTEMKQKRIHPQKIANSKQKDELLEDTRAADNFKNLFEAPVIFYVLCTFLMLADFSKNYFLILAWIYVFA